MVQRVPFLGSASMLVLYITKQHYKTVLQQTKIFIGYQLSPLQQTSQLISVKTYVKKENKIKVCMMWGWG